MVSLAETRQLPRRTFDAAVAAAHPSTCLPAHLPEPPANGRINRPRRRQGGRQLMTAAAERFYLDNKHGVDPARLSPASPWPASAMARLTRRSWRWWRRATPSRTPPAWAAARRAPGAGGGPTAQDLVLVLVSGGGSANWIAPAGALTLLKSRQITKALLRSGAPSARSTRCGSAVAGSRADGWRAPPHPARLVTLAISDVPGDDPSMIASGPTVPDPTTTAERSREPSNANGRRITDVKRGFAPC